MLKRVVRNVDLIIAISIAAVVALLAALGTASGRVVFPALLAVMASLLLSVLRLSERSQSQLDTLSEVTAANESIALGLKALRESRGRIELITGHEETEAFYVELVESARAEHFAFGRGVDLSDPAIAVDVAQYLDALKEMAKRGISYHRLQIVANAPLAWLEYLGELLDFAESSPSWDVQIRMTGEDSEANILRIWQVFIADSHLVGLMVNSEVGSEDHEFAIRLEDRDAASALRAHIRRVAWARAPELTKPQLERWIEDERGKRERRCEEFLSREFLSVPLPGRMFKVPPPGREFRRMLTDVPDYSLHVEAIRKLEQHR